MAKFFAVCVLLLCFSEAFGRKCYVCDSEVSLEDCDKNRKEVTCPSGEDYCGEISRVPVLANKNGTKQAKSFAKSCSTKATCDNPSNLLKACKEGNVVAICTYRCCGSDLCKAGNAVPMVSIFMMLACALVTFFL